MHRYPLPGVLHGDILGEEVDGRLADAVGRAAQIGVEAAHGADVDDGAAAILGHEGHRRLAGQIHALEVGVDDAEEVL